MKNNNLINISDDELMELVKSIKGWSSVSKQLVCPNFVNGVDQTGVIPVNSVPNQNTISKRLFVGYLSGTFYNYVDRQTGFVLFLENKQNVSGNTTILNLNSSAPTATFIAQGNDVLTTIGFDVGFYYSNLTLMPISTSLLIFDSFQNTSPDDYCFEGQFVGYMFTAN